MIPKFEKNDDLKWNYVQLMMDLWKWNSDVQGYRNRYSRDIISLKDIEKSTNMLVKNILSYTNPSLKVSEIIDKNSKKLETRIDAYKPDIDFKDYIADYNDFPKAWIVFKDISPLLKDKKVLEFAIDEMSQKSKDSDVIVWLDARGFIFGSLIAKKLWKPFVMLRKKWKLPGETIEKDYWLEYGNDVIELQVDAIKKWKKVSLIDDLLATWGTIKAAIDLVEKVWGEVNNIAFAISLDDDELVWMPNRKDLENYEVNSLVSY